MVQAGSAAPSWDKKGNLTSDGTNSYVYTSENLLATIANPGPHSTATSLAYDPLGRLREIGSNSTALWEQLVEDQQGQVAFEVQTLSRTVRNMFGPEPDEIVAGDRIAPTFSARTWYYQDERGSVIAAEDGTGTPRINRYDDYGTPGGSNSGRFQYTGQYWLAEPSIYYYKARFYDPKLGLFLQTDPKGYDAGANLYAYVDDDPMNKTDPDGEELIAAGIGGAIGFFGGIGLQALDDFSRGHMSDLRTYTASGLGGAAGGATFGLTGNAKLAGAVSGAVTEGANSLMHGESLGTAGRKALEGGLVGGLAGHYGGRLAASGKGLVGRLAGRTAVGRAIANNERMAGMIMGRLGAGQINRVSGRTFAKMTVAGVTSTAASAKASSVVLSRVNSLRPSAHDQ